MISIGRIVLKPPPFFGSFDLRFPEGVGGPEGSPQDEIKDTPKDTPKVPLKPPIKPQKDHSVLKPPPPPKKIKKTQRTSEERRNNSLNVKTAVNLFFILTV